jgi:hypothetical protein
MLPFAQYSKRYEEYFEKWEEYEERGSYEYAVVEDMVR